MHSTLGSAELSFRAHLIWISGTRSDPLLRVIVATTPKVDAVFDGIQLWSTCSIWIKRLKHENDIALGIAGVKRTLVKNSYATFQLKTSVDEIESFGLCRADRLDGFENSEARREKAE